MYYKTNKNRLFAKVFLLGLFCLTITFTANTQEVANSTSKVISSKAAKGSLYFYSDEGEYIELTYLIKENKKGLTIESYFFDKKDLKFIETKEEFIPKEKKKKRFKKTKSVRTSMEGQRILRVYANLLGRPVLKIGTISYSYAGRAVIEHFNVIEEQKPRGADGDKMHYVHSRTVESDNKKINWNNSDRNLNYGDVQLVVIENQEPLYSQYYSQVYKAEDLSLKANNKIDLPGTYMMVSADNLDNGDITLLMKSVTDNDLAKAVSKHVKRFKTAETFHLKYIRINGDGEVIENIDIPIEQPKESFLIDMRVVGDDSSDEVMIVGTYSQVGPTMPYFKSGPFYDTDAFVVHKAEKLFIAKIAGGKVAFSMSHPIESYLNNVKLIDEASVPKNTSKMKIGAIPITFASVQNKNVLTFQEGNTISLMQIDDQGDIETHYFMTPPKGRILNLLPEYYANDKGDLYLFYYHQPKLKKDASTEDKTKAASARECVVRKMDFANNKIGDGVSITPGGTLDLHDPFFFEDENTFITLGKGRKKEIVLSRIKL